MSRPDPMCFVVIITVLSVFLVSFASAGSVESVQVLKISGSDERAVIKNPDGNMQMIRVGDALGERGRVIEIADGRIVVEEKTDQGTETVIIKVEDGRQRIERVRRGGDKQPAVYAPK
jgi:Tfp pilus assembly protein PilP